METTKPPKAVKCPVDAIDLTKGKEYKVLNIMSHTKMSGHFFTLKDDIGAKIYCKEKKCLHIQGQDWEIIK